MLEITMIGHIGQDAVIKTVNGKSFISFSVASTERFTNQAGEIHEKTTWVNFTRNYNPESKLFEYLKKGTMVYVKGSVSISPYSDNLGKPSASLNSYAKEIQLLGGNKQKTDDTSTSSECSTTASSIEAPAPIPISSEDDLPF